MTTHTGTAAAASTAKPGLPTSTPVFWSLIAVTVTITILLTGWTAAQAVVINDAVNGNGPSHPSIRQLERPAQGDDAQHYSIRQLERAAETERQAPQHASIRQVERATSVTVEPPRFVSIRQVERAEQERSDQLRQLEAAETQRFTNRADVTGELPPSTTDRPAVSCSTWSTRSCGGSATAPRPARCRRWTPRSSACGWSWADRRCRVARTSDRCPADPAGHRHVPQVMAGIGRAHWPGSTGVGAASCEPVRIEGTRSSAGPESRAGSSDV